jgi:hypothetical protein
VVDERSYLRQQSHGTALSKCVLNDERAPSILSLQNFAKEVHIESLSGKNIFDPQTSQFFVALF